MIVAALGNPVSIVIRKGGVAFGSRSGSGIFGYNGVGAARTLGPDEQRRAACRRVWRENRYLKSSDGLPIRTQESPTRPFRGPSGASTTPAQDESHCAAAHLPTAVGSGGGAWFEWDDKVTVFLHNWPCKAPYRVDAQGNDQSGGYLIKAFINGWNPRAHPFLWTETPEQILAKAHRPTTSNTRH